MQRIFTLIFFTPESPEGGLLCAHSPSELVPVYRETRGTGWKKILTLILIFVFVFTKLTIAQPDGTLDQSFNAGDFGFGYGTYAGGSAAVIQPDGKILAFGVGSARLKTNGDLDSTFITSNLHTKCIALQPDGKIVAGGYFTQYFGVSRNFILRLDSFGNLDTTFDPGTGFDNYVLALALQPDGKIVAGGTFSAYNGDSITGIARLHPDGTLDTSFHSGLSTYSYAQAIEMQPDGKIIIGGGFLNYDGIPARCIARLNADGSLDTTFVQGTGFNASAPSIDALAIQPDGKIIAGGFFNSYNSVPVSNSIIRLNNDGSRDTTFGNIGFGGKVLTIALQADGKALVGGGFYSCDTVTSNSIARLDTNGRVDTTFNSGSGFNWDVKCIAVQSNGQAIVTGDFFTYYNKFGRNGIIRLNSDASPDTSFFRNTGLNNEALTIALQQDGKILTGGGFTSYNNKPYFSVARMLPDGTPDSSFQQHNLLIRSIVDMIVQPDGKILISGGVLSPPNNYITRLNSDGSYDTTFVAGSIGGGGGLSKMQLQPDGKILILKIDGVCRLNTNGSIDTTLNTGAGFDNYPYAIQLQPDGKIIVAGDFTSYNGYTCYRIARLNADGAFDTTFNTGTGFDFWGAEVLALQADGKIIVGGDFGTFNGNARNGIVRLHPGGSEDTSFVSGGGFSNRVRSIIIQPDGKIIVGGYFSSYNGHSSHSIARLNTSGSYDTTFNVGYGFDYWVMDQALQQDGKLILVGTFTEYNGIGRNRIARLHAFNTTGIGEQSGNDNNDNNIYVFPNPAKKFIVINSASAVKSSYEITITDIKGNLCFQTANNALPATINIGNLSNGIYFATIDDGKQKAVKKFLKE